MKKWLMLSLIGSALVFCFNQPLVYAEDAAETSSDAAVGSVRIDWGAGNNAMSNPNSSTSSRVVRLPSPGAPELPANFMFGGGFLVLGFGLLLTRRLW